jgi:hypothetical protein
MALPSPLLPSSSTQILIPQQVPPEKRKKMPIGTLDASLLNHAEVIG